MTKASTLRSDLGYTEADLAELKNVVCNGDQAADLPPFPRPADYAARRAIYQFLQTHGKYAPMLAWCRSKEITKGFSGVRTSELYADDPAAKERHWQLANTKEQYYNVILANETFIASETPEALRRVNAEKALFYKLLDILFATIRGGEWGAVPPSEVIDIMPPDRIEELNANIKKIAKTGKPPMNKVAIARLFGVSRKTIYNWLDGDGTPEEWPGIQADNDTMRRAADKYKARRTITKLDRTKKGKLGYIEGITEKYTE